MGMKFGVSKLDLEKMSRQSSVQTGETLIIPEIITSYNMGMKFGALKLDLEKMSRQSSVQTGEKPIIPETITSEEKELLARLVTAEAKGEPYEGKVEVATVVLNRVDHEQYPDTIEEVIYEKRQFQPVDNGTINKPAVKEAEKAVNEAIVLEMEGEGNDSLNFYNPKIVDSKWHRSKTVTARIGDHVFTK
ncbi:cell wall hydrolase [Bacillus sp. V3B]|nr:cell wall hydrolase [Bacillus sp. V3B]